MTSLPYITFIVGMFIGCLLGTYVSEQPRDERGRYIKTGELDD